MILRIPLLWLLLVGLFLGSPQAAMAQQLTAAVMERPHGWTQNCGGLVKLLTAAGFKVQNLDLAKSAPAQGVDLIVFGTFCTEHQDYKTYQGVHGASLATFVAGGGIVLQFAQADQTERTVPFLPAGMLAQRCDDDHGPILVKDENHPLLVPMKFTAHQPPRLLLSYYCGRPGVWENLNNFAGMRVLMAADWGNSFPLLLEGQHGKGRFLLTSLYLDTVYTGTGKLAAPAGWLGASTSFFKGLAAYVGLVKAGKAPQVLVTPPYKVPVAAPFVPGSFTLVALPDTQVYAMTYAQHFHAQTTWIAANKQKLNIKYVLHLGDVTNNNTVAQWTVAKAAMSRLDGVVPYAIAPGNHDYGANGGTADRSTLLNTYFKVADCEKWPTFGGVFAPGKLDNSYHTFGGHGAELLILALEFGPRNSVVNWANQVVARHPDHRVIMITHAYMYYDGARYDWATHGTAQSWNPHAYKTGTVAAGTNDGEELFRKLVCPNPNFMLCLNGHVLGDGVGRLNSRNDHGDGVAQVLANYQMKTQGGQGFLRLLEFLPTGRAIQVKTYSPVLNQYKTDPKNQFVIPLRPALAIKGK